MKTKDSILRLSAAALLSAVALASVAFSSCSSDDFAPDPIKDIPAENGMATVNLVFSVPSIETRAEGDDDDSNGAYGQNAVKGYAPVDTNAKEDVIDNLWVYFFKKNGEAYEFFKAFNITENENVDGVSLKNPGIISSGDDYDTIIENFIVPEGDYHIYVMANLSDYNTTITPSDEDSFSIDESDLENATFNTKIETNYADGSGVFCGALPMAAYYSDVTLSSTTASTSAVKNEDGSITIKKGSVTLQATMTYLCAKVRYTFFFDNTAPKIESDGTITAGGFSYPYETFEYQEIGVHNAMKNAALYPDKIGTGILSTSMAQKNVIDNPTNYWEGCVLSEFPEEGVESWIGSDDSYIPEKLTARNDGVSKPTTGKIAYQGIVYLSENRNCSKATTKNADGERNTDGTKTYLHFKVKLDGKAQDYVINLPDSSTGSDANYLQQGNFYDIIGKITATGMSFNVRVKRWVKASENAAVMPLGL